MVNVECLEQADAMLSMITANDVCRSLPDVRHLSPKHLSAHATLEYTYVCIEPLSTTMGNDDTAMTVLHKNIDAAHLCSVLSLSKPPSWLCGIRLFGQSLRHFRTAR